MNTVNASHILVKTEKQAQEILEKIKNKKMSFQEAAKKYSFCPSKSQGGNLGEFARGMMVKEFEDACFNQNNKIGDILGPIKTEFGFHIIRIDKIN
jgi:peptidyl-prolyl cis-trans isomerase C